MLVNNNKTRTLNVSAKSASDTNWTSGQLQNESTANYTKKSTSTKTTRFQAKFTAEIYEQLQYVLQQSSNLDEARAIIQRTTDQSKRLAIFGFSQAKNQERVARNYAIDAINIPASIRYQVPKKENYKTTNAFSDEFMYPLSHARFEQDLQKTTNNKDKGRGGFNNNGYRGQSRGGYRGRGRPHFFEGRGNNTTTYNQNNNQSQQ
ncbi:hypothetical protein G6F57_010021 [Rhizopus arrhizus]|uniref:Uncharacterized protein n=1 Tax=Rhizopus oryzae TaxID=64495 RepID=A0A9P6X9M7_RHIOR|nr:hypothetical protein G6F24_009924 [Rhizopus arrhizus]KAG1427115.1 hypothetical protein G6F58_001174 [Rhizopus delemar]KAG0789700.1 hypothetical protein G6F21_006332 [Rhizopus arrhizus]KAG0798633.1 hypothetical protein G6F22_004029 [Rhizopus arrhizus]KAG0811423.1 hypothetical protein G6F20_007167 [Rhizopus arrhizus]